MVIENHKKPVKYVDKVEKGYSRTDLAANRLIELILEKGFQPGDKLPNEYELAARAQRGAGGNPAAGITQYPEGPAGGGYLCCSEDGNSRGPPGPDLHWA